MLTVVVDRTAPADRLAELPGDGDDMVGLVVSGSVDGSLDCPCCI